METAMPTVRLRVNANEDDNRELMNALLSIEGIEHVEEVGDLMPHGDDEDSSSAGLPDDASPGFHQLEIETSNEEGTPRPCVGGASRRADGRRHRDRGRVLRTCSKSCCACHLARMRCSRRSCTGTYTALSALRHAPPVSSTGQAMAVLATDF
jgi:hypothetical protein